MPRISTDNYDTVASWNGSQDLFVVEQPDGTKVATPAMVKQYVLGNSIDDVYSVMGQMGAKNLIPYPYYRASGYSSNGMTTTYDSDGVMTINKVAGSSTAFFALTYTDDNYCLKPNTKYKLLAEFDNTTQLSVFAKYGDTDIAIINKKPTGKYAVNFTTPQTLEGRENIAIFAASSDTETNAKVKVMIMLASDINDDTYVPFAMTNRQLTETIGDLTQTGLTGDSVAEQLTTAKGLIAGRAECFKSSSNGATQSIKIGAIAENRIFLFACGFHTNYVLELIAISSNGANVVHVPVANSGINSISSISYDANSGVMSITVQSNPFGYGRMTRLS